MTNDRLQTFHLFDRFCTIDHTKLVETSNSEDKCVKQRELRKSPENGKTCSSALQHCPARIFTENGRLIFHKIFPYIL